ncbi:hypothetical protein [Algoriella sp.]|uniref:hypothetical protein n=1 Tax=Algoriella sp. TaxID=1872434 RepID=UPI001B02EA4D|nr:hypothetical protein [Algoriella sp.]MBO6213300.1 hypothetical protein [Algoriella sp.]
MKKTCLLLILLISSFSFANDQTETSFFSDSNSNTSSAGDIGVVDDLDEPIGSPINDYILPLIVGGLAIGFYYSRRKIILDK